MNVKALSIVLGGTLLVSWAIFTLVLMTKNSAQRLDAPATLAEPDTPRDNPDANALRRELALLGAQVATLQQQLTERETHTSTQDPGETKHATHQDALTPAQHNEATRQAMLARMNAIDERHINEIVDSNWASLAETRIIEGLHGEALAQATLQDVDCRSTLCKLALNTSRQTDLSGLRMDLAMGLSDVISQGAMRVVNPDAENREVVFYLARKGHELPGIEGYNGTGAN